MINHRQSITCVVSCEQYAYVRSCKTSSAPTWACLRPHWRSCDSFDCCTDYIRARHTPFCSSF